MGLYCKQKMVFNKLNLFKPTIVGVGQYCINEWVLNKLFVPTDEVVLYAYTRIGFVHSSTRNGKFN